MLNSNRTNSAVQRVRKDRAPQTVPNPRHNHRRWSKEHSHCLWADDKTIIVISDYPPIIPAMPIQRPDGYPLIMASARITKQERRQLINYFLEHRPTKVFDLEHFKWLLDGYLENRKKGVRNAA